MKKFFEHYQYLEDVKTLRGKDYCYLGSLVELLVYRFGLPGFMFFPGMMFYRN